MVRLDDLLRTSVLSIFSARLDRIAVTTAASFLMLGRRDHANGQFLLRLALNAALIDAALAGTGRSSCQW